MKLKEWKWELLKLLYMYALLVYVSRTPASSVIRYPGDTQRRYASQRHHQQHMP